MRGRFIRPISPSSAVNTASGAFQAGDLRVAWPDAVLTADEGEIGRMNRPRIDLHQDFASPGFGPWDIDQAQDIIRLAGRVEDDCQHGTHAAAPATPMTFR